MAAPLGTQSNTVENCVLRSMWKCLLPLLRPVRPPTMKCLVLIIIIASTEDTSLSQMECLRSWLPRLQNTGSLLWKITHVKVPLTCFLQISSALKLPTKENRVFTETYGFCCVFGSLKWSPTLSQSYTSFSFLLKQIHILCIWVFCLHVHHKCACGGQKREGIEFSATGVTV